MPTFDLLTIGHSNIPADRFIGLLRGAGANAVADVRSTPASRRFPWFAKNNLAARLQQEGMAYLPFGDTLGGRPREASITTALPITRQWPSVRNSARTSTACAPLRHGIASD